ncbi:MAG: phosphomannomutase/phosphoglucomutase, partial [Chloroflexi bacterium]|nr:phosphomannomutase/phosphoglucomutase [Chloroflexota bacterium]
EVSGHYFFGELRGDDALYATLLLLRVLDRLGIPLSEAMATVPAYPITPDIRLPCTPETVRAILEELAKAFADLPLSFLDGVRIAFPEGWALARPSVTEPLITLRFEARSERALQEIQRAVRDASPTLRGIGWEEGIQQ